MLKNNSSTIDQFMAVVITPIIINSFIRFRIACVSILILLFSKANIEA